MSSAISASPWAMNASTNTAKKLGSISRRRSSSGLNHLNTGSS
jgi:hypothetical protein